MSRFLLAVALLVLASPALGAGELKGADCLRQGAAYLEAKEYQRAVRAFGQAIQQDRGDAQAHKGLAAAYLGLGAGEAATDVELVGKAVAEYREAVRLAPDSAQLRQQLGLACLLIDDLNCAVQEHRALKDLDPALARQLNARIAAYRPPKTFQPLKNQPNEDQEQGATRVTIAGNAVLVPVSFSHRGKTVQATLVLDTGASSTMITRELADRLDLDLNSSALATVMVADGRYLRMRHTKLDLVTVGSKSKSNLGVYVAPDNGGRFPFDGLLGMNFLRSFSYSIDFSNQVINWSR